MRTVAVFAVCVFLAVNSVSGWNIICENSRGNIQCPPGQKIKVDSANYGRTHDGSICPYGATSHQNCRAKDSSRQINNACNNKQGCYLAANNGVFGDPCVGIVKYIEVTYRCVTA